ncbi:MAG TPA: preprotein translocase subunit SecA [Bacilli bacterium]|jgi:preprotein translocase subunit SecA|nr:preprotein translocase subunit SecA [Acholeplasmataceae bacterium]OQB61315.1 MAG: preprotein translocase subunit SecA [Tenericutes bacterium ADurb.Bin140]HOE78061.1 preprotein translocase subunit SecA [Bacilli bacterium]HON64440.1 preprotein translocase subunit SecA [Bacilli bacterium]HOR96338.1 preprotein translocase subunit SecA [Bacilli bacterium]
MFKKWFDASYKEYKRCVKIAEEVDKKAEEYRKKTDEELKAMTPYFKEQLAKGASLDDIMVDAFATAREACTRVSGLTPYKVQIIGAAAMHFGNIAEMKTGEGKTLTSVMTAYLNALPGQGVHIVTVNEYLASRDARDMGAIHNFLGLTVGLNLRELTPEEKRAAYNCDITYSTNNELGFDYLRDHMVLYKENIVQRPLNFAIVDEVDSILIDEARTPLIISGGEKKGPNLYVQAQTFVRGLQEDDYEIDIKAKHIALTESGIAKAERFFGVDNFYDIRYVRLVHHVNNALRANYIMTRDIDYVVQDGKVIIVDPFTGRLMHGRQYSEGLHQALEAKERVEIKKETRTLATITFQNYFRMYKKLAGMTGTAKTEEEEFRNIYNMLVVEIPTNKPVIRIDDNDLMFATMNAKYKAIVKDIEERHKKGQPVLVGTISIETSELISEMLKRRGIPHSVLNAKHHEKEADIIARAGQKGAVTIATNMAGRGTDIKLGEGVKELGGLAVIGTERHEARRIDNQLRGRSGRQGDPGYSRFYLSAEDDLMKRFAGDRFKSLLNMIAKPDQEGNETPLDLKMFSRFVESAQRKVEGSNYDRRKSVVEYDEVLRKQREIIYQQRNDILFLDDMEPTVLKMMDSVIERNVERYVTSAGKKATLDLKNFMTNVAWRFFNHNEWSESDFENKTVPEVKEMLIDKLKANLEDKKNSIPLELYREFLKVIMLRVVDRYWMDHIDQMSELRQSIGLKSYAQINPLREYQEIGFEMFETMVNNIEEEVVTFVSRAQIRDNLEREEVAKPTGTNAGEEPVKKKPVVVGKKIGRNDPCPCGSGRKYKYCCGRNE